MVLKNSFKEDFGNVMDLIYLFDGTGSLDYGWLADSNGETVFEDGFRKDSLTFVQ